jgi:type II secretory pathway pseudopilin PulG
MINISFFSTLPRKVKMKAMPRPSSRTSHPRGTTLLELTIVIMVLLALIGVSMYASGSIGKWKKGREAGEQLRLVYAAQRSYLADNPTVAVSSLTESLLIPYLPDRSSAIPKVTTLEDTTLSIKVNVTPPIVDAGGGTAYDPSGSSEDSLWDVGK